MSVNLKRMLFRRVIRTIRFNLLRTYHGILNDVEYYQLCLKLKLHQYVPKYFTRTAEEHNEIRLKIRRRQNECQHLKGGHVRSLAFKDYAVTDHTYIDGSRLVRCMICRKRWAPETREWTLALEMVQQSSNRASSSEVPMLVTEHDETTGAARGYRSVAEARKAGIKI
jgi:hypothetical protein